MQVKCRCYISSHAGVIVGIKRLPISHIAANNMQVDILSLSGQDIY